MEKPGPHLLTSCLFSSTARAWGEQFLEIKLSSGRFKRIPESWGKHVKRTHLQQADNLKSKAVFTSSFH